MWQATNSFSYHVRYALISLDQPPASFSGGLPPNAPPPLPSHILVSCPSARLTDLASSLTTLVAFCLPRSLPLPSTSFPPSLNQVADRRLHEGG